MIRFLRFACLLLTLSLLCNRNLARAQDATLDPPAASQPQSRTKIGVALEGGGALGLAHVGVLDWFEQHHIPVDYIAGTSMGGLVGGLYAIGKSPQEQAT